MRNKYLLGFLTLSNILIYIDRGVIAALIYKLKEDLDLKDSQAGVLGSLFMLGFMSTSPVFAHWSQKVPPMRLISIGLCIWELGTLLASLSNSFSMILVARVLTGVAEAPICPLAPPLILDYSPKKSKSVRTT